MIYAVNFSGGTWSNDSGESPYYCGAYSSMEKAEEYTRRAMIEELLCACGAEEYEDDNGETIDLKTIPFEELQNIYAEMDCSYLIKESEAGPAEIVYALDYRPNGYRHGSLGIFNSIDDAKNKALEMMIQELKSDGVLGNKTLSDDETRSLFKKRIGLDDNTIFITELKMDSEFFHLVWNGDYWAGEEVTLDATNEKHEWYTVIKAADE